MNAGAQARLEGFAALVELNGSVFDVLDGQNGLGGQICGILALVPPLDPAMELGADWREMGCLEMLRPAPANAQMDVQLRETGTLNKWKIVKREDNPATFTVKFWCVKVTTQDT